jgi:predicted anti-sigma-YlaC factor YlaD
MTCPEFESRLSAYLDGELSRWRRWKVETHVRYCDDCAQMLRELDEVDGAILTCAQEAATPDYLTAAVMHRLPAMPPAQDPRRAWLRKPVGAVFALSVVGAQMVALGGAYWWGFIHGSVQPHAASVVGASGASRREILPAANTPRTVRPAEGAEDRSSRPTYRPGGVWTKPNSRFGEPNFSVLPEDQPADKRQQSPARRMPRMPLSNPLSSPLSSPLSNPLPVAR